MAILDTSILPVSAQLRPFGYIDRLARRFLAPLVFRPPIGTKGGWITTTFNGDQLSILQRNEPIIVLLRHRLHPFWCRLGQLLDKPACGSYTRKPLERLHQIKNKPGEPRNTAKAGTTVFGGRMVLSSIFAQSLIMQNFPCQVANPSAKHVSIQCCEMSFRCRGGIGADVL